MAGINTTQHITQIIEQYFTKKNGGAKQAAADLKELEGTSERITKKVKDFTSVSEALDDSLQRQGGFDFNTKQTEDLAKGYEKLTKSTDKSTKSTQKGTQAYRQINFEFLGVMFFGQAVANTFRSMLEPAAQLYGVQELWGLTLQDLFLPVMEALFPIFLAFSEWLMDLPEETKQTLGVMVVLGMIFGQLAGAIGTLTLGFQALLVAGKVQPAMISSLANSASTLVTALTTLAGLGLIAVGISLEVSALKEEGIQYWADICGGIATGLGLTLVTKTPALGSIPLTGAAILLYIGLDVLFDSLERPGLQIFQDIIAGFAAGIGLATMAGVIAGSLSVATGVATITIPLSIILAITLDWMWSDTQKAVKQGETLWNKWAKEGTTIPTTISPDIISPDILWIENGTTPFDSTGSTHPMSYNASTTTITVNATTSDEKRIADAVSKVVERNVTIRGST